MKKVLLHSFAIVSFILTSYTLNAQSIVVNTQNTTITGAADEFELELGLSVTNNSSEQKDIKVRRTVLSPITGSSNFFCWLACYVEGVSLTPNPLTMDGGATSTAFSAHLRPNMNSGTAQIQYTFFDANNTSDSTNVVVTFEVTPLGIKNVSSETALKAFPNPVDDKLNISFARSTNNETASIELFNMLGVKVASVQLNSVEGVISIPTEDLKAGLYFYSIRENGKSSKPGRITIKH